MSKEERHDEQTSGTEWLVDLARLINDPGYERWRSMVAATGGCAHPVHLAGESMIVNAGTGEVLHSYTHRRTSRPGICWWPAATGGPRSARPAHRPTRPTPSN